MLLIGIGEMWAQGDDLEFTHVSGPDTHFDDYGGVFPADFDNDGDYDILTFGAENKEGGGFIYSPAILWNNGTGDFTAESLGLDYFTAPASSIRFLDFNNDNSVDIALSADFGFVPYQTVLLENAGDGSFSLANGFNSIDTIATHEIFTFDYDNDGDTDILVRDYVRSIVRPVGFVGYQGSIFANKGNGFFEFDYSFPRLHSLVVLDYNRDGRMDIAKSFREKGFFGPDIIENQLMINNEGALAGDPDNSLPGDQIQQMQVLDVNNDAFPDLYLRATTGFGYVDYFMINNQAGGMDQNYAGLHPELDDFLADPSCQWGDFNLDNRSDLLLTYREQDTMVVETWIQRSEDLFDFEFRKTNTNPPLLRPDSKISTVMPHVDWFDSNGDGKTDVFFGLRDHVDSLSGHLYLNAEAVPQPVLPIPGGLNHYRSGDGIILGWGGQEDNSMSYNVRVGTSPGGVDLVSPMADPVTGFLRYKSSGNAGYNDFYRLDTIADGKYYWSVQAVSKSFTGGEWASEQSFIIGDIYVDFDADTVCLGEFTRFKNISHMEDWELDSIRWEFGDGNHSQANAPNHQYLSSGTYEVALRCYTGGEEYSATKVVVVRPSPVADFLLEDHCLGEVSPITNLSEDNGSGILSWLWDFDDGTSLREANPANHGFINSGTYNVKLVLESENGCGDSLSRVVNVLPLPEVLLKLDGTACIDPNFRLTTTYSPAFAFQWKFAGGNIPDATAASYYPKVPGDYSVVVSSECGEVSDSYIIEEPSFSILAEGTPCKGSDFMLSTQQEDTYSYQWYFMDNVIQGAGESTHYPQEAGEYAVDVGTSCGVYRADYTVNLLTGLPKPEIIVIGPEVWILVCSNDSASEYRWYEDEFLISGENSPVLYPGEHTGLYRVEISDGSECFSSSDAVQIPPATNDVGVEHISGMKIFPNPGTGVFNIRQEKEIKGEVMIQVCRMDGSVVLNSKISHGGHNEALLDLSNEPPGIYSLKLISGASQYVSILILE